MRKILLSIGLVFALAFGGAVAQQYTGGNTPQLHVMSFCSTGCDSTSATFVVPFGTQQLWADYCGSGGSGGGGYTSATNSGGGGGGGAALCIVHLPISAPPGTTITHIVNAGNSGGNAGASGANGNANFLTWTVGAYSFTTPAAWPGIFGGAGTTTTGGNSGGSGATINNTTTGGTGPVFTIPGSVTGTTGTATVAASVAQAPSFWWIGAAGGAGGGNNAGTASIGTAARLQLWATGVSAVAGGAASNTSCGGGGAGGSSYFSNGTVGATVAGTAGTQPGAAAGGSGGACNGAGGQGGETITVYSWIQ